MIAFRLLPLLALLVVPAHAEVLGIGKDSAEAVIIDANGLPIGKATLKMSKKKGLQLSVSVKGLPSGDKGIHIHAIGSCAAPDFAGAGPHWNPHGKMHGLESADGPHSGDMPNLRVNRRGKAKLKHDFPEGQLKGDTGVMDADGGAIVIHAQSDDQRTDPSGNSGKRIACGIFVK